MRGYGVSGCAGNEMEQACFAEIMACGFHLPEQIEIKKGLAKCVKSKSLALSQSVAVLCRLWIEEEERVRGYGVSGCAGNEMEQACFAEIMACGFHLPEQIEIKKGLAKCVNPKSLALINP